MQEENRSFSHFSQRTEALASALGMPLGDLPEIIGVSERMFYGYRSGAYPISGKAWRKLAEAEVRIISPSARDGPADPPPDCRRYPAEPPPVPVSVLGDITTSASLADELATIRHLLEMAMTRLEIIESKHRTSP